MSSQVRSYLRSTSKEKEEKLEPTRLPIPINVPIRRTLTARQIAKLLEEENIGEFEAGQNFNLPYNITK